MRSTTAIDLNQETVNTNHLSTLKTLGRYLWPAGRSDLKVRVVSALLFLAIAKILNVTVPYLLKLIIDDFSSETELLTLPLALIIAYGVTRIGVAAFGELRDLTFVRMGQDAQRKIALNTFKHLHGLSLNFHLSRQTGGLSRVIERGTRGIQFVLSFMTFNIVPTLFEILLVTLVLIYNFGFLYATIIFLTISSYIASTLILTEWRLKYRKKMNTAESTANTKAIDSLINFETVKYFCNETFEYQRYDESLARYESAAIRNQRSLSLLNLIQASIIGLGLISIMWLAGHAVTEGQMTIGDFVLVNSYLIQLYSPLNFLGFVYREVKNSLVDMDKMFELIQVNTSVADRPDATPLKLHRGVVEFRNVHFFYNADRPILKGISFKALPGQKIAIVGASGAGKSTIARLLFRFYDVSRGAILIDDQDLRATTQTSVRESIGVVPQDTVLFNDTIGYNIRYGNPDCSQQQIEQAARMANIHQFISGLTEQYETQVGERGLKLSGGEKQRIAIARTILKNPKIIIFDEATSALDSENEESIQTALKTLEADRTTLVIAHRLSTISDADEILVLDHGEIRERGRHADLLRANGLYAQMWNQQKE